MAGSADAAEILVTADIATSTTWTADNTYNLQTQIYVLPGATLTIEAGTVVASTPTANGSGSLAVTKGAQIFVCGTKQDPVIMTSTADVATWDVDASHPTGKDPKTGTWREAANEWGNLTIMGCGYISEDETPGNVPTCDEDNVAAMEGLVAQFPGDPNVLYGGGDDDDDSGKIEYLSIRYGGRVVGLTNELNGLSLGGIGRETDINHVEIMNNVDDGIEIWGGCVYLKYFSIWNVGDDSLDIDQGYRGCIQFGLIVQGYSLQSSQGSGVGDNCIETDGAENSDWQPVTSTTIYNVTVIGQPLSGDGGTAWRDNARVQYRNCLWMDLGDQLVRFDNLDGDGAQGYGHNGTLSWADTWTTSSAVTSLVNPCPDPSAIYKSQLPGNLAEIRDSVFFRNLAGGGTGVQTDPAYTEAVARGVFNAGNDNVLITGTAVADQPITSITRGALVPIPGLPQLPVTELDPRPANEALTSVDQAPDNGFFWPARYRGGFAPGEHWVSSWTASFAFGFTPLIYPWCEEKCSLAGVTGHPRLIGTGDLTPLSSNRLDLYNAAPSALCVLFVGSGLTPVPFKGGILKPWPAALEVFLFTTPSGTLPIPFILPAGFSGFSLVFQYAIQDAAAINGVSLSTSLTGTFQ